MIHADETSIRVSAQSWWLHVMASATVTLLVCHRRRGREAIDAIDVLPGYRGVIVHDGLATYDYLDAEHAQCSAYLVRHLNGCAEHPDTARFARLMTAALLVDASAARTRHRHNAVGDLRFERQPDLLVSTLGEYINGTGGRLRLIADYGTHEVDLDLAALRAEPVEAEREFRVVWQNLQTRQLVHVGWLHVGAGRYAFQYTPDAELDRDFQPFVGFPDLRRGYEANKLSRSSPTALLRRPSQASTTWSTLSDSVATLPPPSSSSPAPGAGRRTTPSDRPRARTALRWKLEPTVPRFRHKSC